MSDKATSLLDSLNRLVSEHTSKVIAEMPPLEGECECGNNEFILFEFSTRQSNVQTVGGKFYGECGEPFPLADFALYACDNCDRAYSAKNVDAEGIVWQ